MACPMGKTFACQKGKKWRGGAKKGGILGAIYYRIWFLGAFSFSFFANSPRVFNRPFYLAAPQGYQRRIISSFSRSNFKGNFLVRGFLPGRQPGSNAVLIKKRMAFFYLFASLSLATCPYNGRRGMGERAYSNTPLRYGRHHRWLGKIFTFQMPSRGFGDFDCDKLANKCFLCFCAFCVFCV